MFLYIARHAWAGHYGDPAWPDDSLRELSPDGVERYTHVVKTLAKRGFAPTRIATSPYVRCRQTAEVIAAHVAERPEIEQLESLEPGSDLEALVAWTLEQDGQDVCWVGHNPDVEELAAELVGGAANIRFAKGAVAAISVDGQLEPGGGVLYWLATAKMLGL